MCEYNETWGVRYFDNLSADEKMSSFTFWEEQNGPCYPVFLPTAENVGKCIPYPSPALQEQAEEQGLALLDQMMEQFGGENGDAGGAVAELRKQMSTLWQAREVLLVCGIIAPFFMCGAFMVMLRLFASWLVWALILSVNLAFGLLALGCAAKAGLIGNHAGTIGARLEAAVVEHSQDIEASQQHLHCQQC